MADYAIVETGSKQYWVEPKMVLDIEKIELKEGAKQVTLDRVLLTREGETSRIGKPLVDGARVICDLVGEVRGKKVVSYKFRRRKDTEKKIGHRQNYVRLLVKKIEAGK